MLLLTAQRLTSTYDDFRSEASGAGDVMVEKGFCLRVIYENKTKDP